jgi:rRNA processing protein Krr1/Pno1
MTDHLSLNLTQAEPGATPATLQATETVVGILYGFSYQLALSILQNVTAIVICHLAKSETAAVDESRQFRKEVERCIRKNWHLFKDDVT